MSKEHSNSLWSRLDEGQREELLGLLLGKGASIKKAVDICAEWGVPTSTGAVSRFLSAHGVSWRLDRAKEAAEARRDALPPNWEELKRQGMAQKEFELSFRDLSVKEFFLLKSLELEHRKQELKEITEPKKLKLAERRIKAMEAKLVRATEELGKLRNPDVAGNDELRAAVLNTVDEIMGLKKKP